MKKTIVSLITIFLIQIVFISCNTTQKSVNSLNINCSNLDSVNLVLNQSLMDGYIKYIEEYNYAIPLFGIRSINASQYQSNNEELKHYRDVFEVQDAKLKEILLRDSEYVELLKEKAGREEKNKVFERLWKTDRNYRRVRIDRDYALNKSNLLTLKYIYNKYKSENKIFPTDFILEDTRVMFQKQKDIELQRYYDRIKKQCEYQ